MKNDISYKNLILGSAVYILCGLIIEYLICVFNILSNQEVAIKNIDPRLTDASDVVFICLYLLILAFSPVYSGPFF